MGQIDFGSYACDIPSVSLPWYSDDRYDLLLFELQEILDTAGTANAYRMFWNDAAGDYVADNTETYEVSDMMRCHWGITGERVMARIHWTLPGGVPTKIYEVISGSAPWYEGVLAGDLLFDATASATVTIYTINRTITVKDRFLIEGQLDSGARIGISYDRQAKRFVVTEAMC